MSRLEVFKEIITIERYLELLRLEIEETTHNYVYIQDSARRNDVWSREEFNGFQLIFYDTKAQLAETLLLRCMDFEYQYLKKFDIEGKMRKIMATDASIRNNHHKYVYQLWKNLSGFVYCLD